MPRSNQQLCGEQCGQGEEVSLSVAPRCHPGWRQKEGDVMDESIRAADEEASRALRRPEGPSHGQRWTSPVS
jgi:hypothetical protein